MSRLCPLGTVSITFIIIDTRFFGIIVPFLAGKDMLTDKVQFNTNIARATQGFVASLPIDTNSES